eukprot:XP_001707336.1 Hypothetical protein GL50803_19856 [Giardia lamblia ATCC 50803]
MDGIRNGLRLRVAGLLVDALHADLVVPAAHLDNLPGSLVATRENLDDVSPADGHGLDLVLCAKLLGQARGHHLGPGLCVSCEVSLAALATGRGDGGVELHSRLRRVIQKMGQFPFQIELFFWGLSPAQPLWASGGSAMGGGCREQCLPKRFLMDAMAFLLHRRAWTPERSQKAPSGSCTTTFLPSRCCMTSALL